jgi:methyl-accepting chemotaxis protein
MATPPALQTPDLGDAYQNLVDALGRAYWEASSLDTKDLIHGAQESIGDIITAINKQDLADNAALFAQLGSKIKATNAALKKIQDDINTITRNINTAASVLEAISKVLSLVPKI